MWCEMNVGSADKIDEFLHTYIYIYIYVCVCIFKKFGGNNIFI